MSYLTLDIPSGRPANTGLWQRVLRFINEARQRKADEVIKQHSHLLPHELEHSGFGMSSRSEGSLGFRR